MDSQKNEVPLAIKSASRVHKRRWGQTSASKNKLVWPCDVPVERKQRQIQTNTWAKVRAPERKYWSSSVWCCGRVFDCQRISIWQWNARVLVVAPRHWATIRHRAFMLLCLIAHLYCQADNYILILLVVCMYFYLHVPPFSYPHFGIRVRTLHFSTSVKIVHTPNCLKIVFNSWTIIPDLRTHLNRTHLNRTHQFDNQSRVLGALDVVQLQ